MRLYKLKDKQIPNGSGVYFLWSQRELLYIGKSKNLRKRIAQHLGNGFMVQHAVNPEEVWRVSVILTSDEFDAERLEQQLIKLIPTKNNQNQFYKYERYNEWKFHGLPSIDVELCETMRKIYYDDQDHFLIQNTEEATENELFQKETGGTKNGKD